MSKQQTDTAARLAAYFDPSELHWKPQTVKGERALAVCYIDARAVMDRLDEVVGVGGWQDEYTFLPDGGCACRLSLRLDDEWVTKADVGSESEQPDDGDRRKSAVSDALKRAAVKFGVGRYLYRLPLQWCDYDPQKRAFRSQPALPAWAAPQRSPQPQQRSAPGRPLDATAPPVPPDGVPAGLLSLYAPGREPSSPLTADEGLALWHEIGRKGYDPAAWLRKRGLDAMTDLTAAGAWEAVPGVIAARKRPAKEAVS